ncbi:MAG: hypothetical protein IPN90_08600 [Elusimicrobia bacterium]|nr:hypothetical protein [Elusimicrobiota bacterium]
MPPSPSRHSAGVLLVLMVFAAGSGWAAKPAPKPLPVKLTAKMTNRFNWDTKKDNPYEDTSRTTTDINAQLKYLPNPIVQVVAGEWMVDQKIRPYNIYMNLTYEHVNLRFGNQIVRWGKADEISPLDVVNPEDLSLGLNRPRADRKIPVPMANVEFLSDYISLQGIYVPFSQTSIFHYSGDDWAYFGHLEKKYGPLNIIEEVPAQTPKNGAWGGRLSGTIGRLDLALVYLNHQSNTPSLMSFPFPPPAAPPGHESSLEDLVVFSNISHQPLKFHYLREELYGLEFETAIGSLGLRGDVSYVSSQSFVTSSLQEIRKPVVTGVVGVDYNGSGGSYINVSFSQSQIKDYSIDLAPTRQKTSTLSSQFSLELLSGNIKLGYLGFTNITDKSFYQNPKVNINYIPNVGIECGLEVYGGSPSTQIGFFDPNDQAYLTLSFFF